MSTHASALLLAALAYRYARRHADDRRFTFGTGKLGDLAGYTSAIVLAMIALLIGYEAVSRFIAPVPISFERGDPDRGARPRRQCRQRAAPERRRASSPSRSWPRPRRMMATTIDHDDAHRIETDCRRAGARDLRARRAAALSAFVRDRRAAVRRRRHDRDGAARRRPPGLHLRGPRRPSRIGRRNSRAARLRRACAARCAARSRIEVAFAEHEHATGRGASGQQYAGRDHPRAGGCGGFGAGDRRAGARTFSRLGLDGPDRRHVRRRRDRGLVLRAGARYRRHPAWT